MTDKPRKTDLELSETNSDANRRRIKDWSNIVPGIGQIVNALVNEIIPDMRMERFEAFMKYLDARIDRVELQAAVNKPEGLDLFEEGLLQAARAFSDDRKKYIAALVSTGLKKENEAQSEARHFMRLLNQLDDRQIILLCGYLPEYSVLGDDVADAFRNKHYEILCPPEETQGGSVLISTGEELNASMVVHLASLGLIDSEDRAKNMGEPMSRKSFEITPLGERFLRYLDLGEEE